MVFRVEKSDRLDITGGTLRYMLTLITRILLFSVVSILAFVVGTLPAAFFGLLLSPTASGLYVVLVILLSTRLATVFLNYDITIYGSELSGVREKITGGPRWRTLFILSAGGLNLLMIVSIAVGSLVAIIAPPIVFMIGSFVVLAANELARKRFDVSISILGVRITRTLLEAATSQSTAERRQLTQLTTAAEWIASSLTVFGQVEQPVNHG